MRNMPPDAMNQAMAQMKDMKPEDWERAKHQLSSMDPDTLASQAAQAQAQVAGRTQYVLNASTQLKNEGNQLHGRGAYKEAVEKYERAKSNVESFTSKEAKDLVRACTLNLSSCYLNLKQFDKCLEQCNQVLSGEPHNLKALYRRGQAYLGSGDCVNAAADLERALRLALETDPSQAQPIREKLQEAKDQIGALRAAGKLPAAAAKPAAVAGAASVEPSQSAAAAAAAPAASTSARFLGLLPHNPASLQMLSSLDPEKLQEMSRAAGLPPGVTITPEMAKAAAESFKQMSPQEVQEAIQTVSKMQQQQQLASMSKMVPGMDKVQLTPEMAKMAAEMMRGMTAEDIARMQEMAAAMHGAGGAGAGAGPGTSSRPAAGAAPGGTGLAAMGGGGSSDAAMASMLSDPKMMESAVRMMKNMDPEALASMMMSSGMCKDRAQAEAMAHQMSNLSDTQLRMMVKTASVVQSARASGARALEWARANVWLVLALLVLLLAFVLRWLGYM
ncbi:hypothetical protein VOLCADRAFT_79055 [Volvox carteri f. nagariensis]|uniref:Uncharacterized protein n=1 Tax=Volvox carteri f. nagariensis TaxID=3068 RepID=D8TJ20_VOLCA|nr:uncharacterized protein VOLCADRAFT_79055 [Volvox carteri f. nagariensis]EFJ52463.1 hypothetical protein VOLCADRAFT_79055 [Volvox carteri f. nagariensis]|eukprot:XP_002946536.1 hypothetical protein VOLCADRAFT_79055 [Volvox carteri f. nagariensis]